MRDGRAVEDKEAVVRMAAVACLGMLPIDDKAARGDQGPLRPRVQRAVPDADVVRGTARRC